MTIYSAKFSSTVLRECDLFLGEFSDVGIDTGPESWYPLVVRHLFRPGFRASIYNYTANN